MDLDLFIEQKKVKSVDAEYEAKVGYWVSFNHLQDYKIYGTMIKMFILEFLSNLQQPPRDNPRPIDLTYQNFKTQFHR